uniref:Proteoglycan 4-like n=1 Tax=Panagrellus redivivus TaxID=6233 RepID=A0A7E4VRS0_PANRE
MPKKGRQYKFIWYSINATCVRTKPRKKVDRRPPFVKVAHNKNIQAVHEESPQRKTQMWGFGLLRLAYFETLQGATGASEDQQDGSRSVMPTATDRSTVNPSVQQKSAKQNTSERQKPSEEPSEKSKATVKQTSAEPSTKKVDPVKQTSAEPSTKKVTPVKQTSVEPSTKKVTPVKQASAEPSTKKVEPPERQ